MTDYQNDIKSLMKKRFGIAAVDITNDILKATGLEMASLDSDSINTFAKEAERLARTLISEKDAVEFYKQLISL